MHPAERGDGETLSESNSKQDDDSVVLLGRPYVVLSETLNKGIPDIFTGMGVFSLVPGYADG